MRIHSELLVKIPEKNKSFRLYIRALSSFFYRLKNWFELLVLYFFRGNRSMQASAEKAFNELILEEQTECHKLNTNLFFWVKHGDLNTLKEKIQEQMKQKGCSEEALIDERDAAGANIIHLAYLLENYKLGRWLVKVYPFVALKPYSSDLPHQAIENKPELAVLKEMEKMMPYTGENLLHMVIVRSNYEEVRWLLDFYKDHKDSVPGGLVRLLTSNAIGSFFRQDGDFYYGGYPLQFAVCSNNIEIFDLVLSFTSSLVSHGVDDSSDNGGDGKMDIELLKDLQSLGSNVIFMRDTFGNTVLHLCVIHGLEDMYRHVFNTAETILKREIKLLYAQTIANSESLGPFELQDLRVLKRHSSICLGYTFKPKKLRRPRIDKFEEWVNLEARMKVEERLTFALNTDFHSPLTLAAARMNHDDHPDVAAKKVEMFKFLLDMHKTVRYEFGIVSFNKFSLLGLEVAYDYNHYDIPVEQRYRLRSAIDWMCSRMAEQALVIPDVRKIIDIKWKRCGLDFFLFDYALHIIQVVCITLISTLINFSPTTSSSVTLVRFTSVLYLVAWVIYLIIFMREVTALYRNTWKYLRTRGVPIFHIVCIALQISSFVLFCLFRISNSTNASQSTDGKSLNYSNVVGVKFCLSLALLSSWTHMYYYLMAFENTGPFMLTLGHIIFVEIPNFLKFYVIVIIAFACGLALLVDNGDCGTLFGFSNIFQTIWVLVQDTLHPSITPSLQIISLANVSDNLRWAADLLLTAYYASVNIVMLNILIAIINATYSFYTEYDPASNSYNNEAMLLVAKYNILNYIECFYPKSRADNRRKKYCIVEHFNREFSPYDAVDDGRSSLKACSIVDDLSASQEYTEYLLETEEKTDYWIHTQDSTEIKANVQNVTVLIVCPQNDFHSGGAFPIDGANEDSKRIAAMIYDHLHQIHNIVVVLEARSQFNISHPSFWVNKSGAFPRPYTVISYQDVKNKVWIPRKNTADILNWCLMYTKTLEHMGQRMLTIWPEHCIVGSRGQAVVSVINDALQKWATHSNRVVSYVTKGENWRTEMFSALEAEIVDPVDCATALNSELLSTLRMSDKVRNSLMNHVRIDFTNTFFLQLIICGHALSHAVNFTMRDLIKHWRGDMSQLVLLEDGEPSTHT